MIVASAEELDVRLAVAAGAAGAALALLVGLDGSPGWQVARVLGVTAVTVTLLVALSRSSDRGRGRLAVLAGVPAVAIAAGFAPHWIKNGPLAVRAAALLLAVAGLALVIGGTAVATHGRRGWRRAATGFAVAVGMAVALLVIGPSVAVTNVPRPAIGASPAA